MRRVVGRPLTMSRNWPMATKFGRWLKISCMCTSASAFSPATGICPGKLRHASRRSAGGKPGELRSCFCSPPRSRDRKASVLECRRMGRCPCRPQSPIRPVYHGASLRNRARRSLTGATPRPRTPNDQPSPPSPPPPHASPPTIPPPQPPPIHPLRRPPPDPPLKLGFQWRDWSGGRSGWGDFPPGGICTLAPWGGGDATSDRSIF